MTRIALCLGLALGTSYAPYATAGVFDQIGNVANTVVNTAEKEVVKGVNTVGNVVTDTADKVVNAGEETANAGLALVDGAGRQITSCTGGVDRCAQQIRNTYYEGIGVVEKIAAPVLRDAEAKVKQGFEEAKKLADTITGPLNYFGKSETYVKQMKEPVEAMAKAFMDLKSTQATLFAELSTAMVTGDGPGIKSALDRALQTMSKTKSGQDTIAWWENLDQGGSMMFFFSASGGVLGKGQLQVGAAVNVGYLVRSLKGIPLNADRDTVAFSLFTAAGLATGAVGKLSGDFNVGYHVNPPQGVNGPSLDVGASVHAVVGGGWGAGFDLTKAPPVPVVAAVAVGAGLGFDVSMGVSYALVLGQFCTESRRFKAGVSECPKLSTPTVNSTNTNTSTTNNTTTNTNTLAPALSTALNCVAQYAKANTCDWNHWSEIYSACKVQTTPAMHNNDMLLNQVKAGQCNWGNWSNLYDQIIGKKPVQVATSNAFKGNLKNIRSNRCLEVFGGKSDNGANVGQWDCHAGANQKVTFTPVSGQADVYTLKFDHSGKCLDIGGGHQGDGANAQQWDCVNVPQQQFKLQALGNDVYNLVAQHSGKLIDVAYASTDNGASVFQWPGPNGWNSQQWRLVKEL